jgi:hypothetical protein
MINKSKHYEKAVALSTMEVIKKSKYYEVNILRGTIGASFDKAAQVIKSRNVIAVKGKDLLTVGTFDHFIPGDVR